MAGKHKKGTPSYDRWIESYRKAKPAKLANANLEARKPHKKVNRDADAEKSVGFASMAPTVKTREFRRQMHEQYRQETGRDPGVRSGYGGVGGQGFGKSWVPEVQPSKDNVRNETLGFTPPGSDADGFIDTHGNEKERKTVEKAVTSSSDEQVDGSLDSGDFANTQAELKKFLGSMPQMAAEQGKKKKAPAYSFEEDGALDKSFNRDRLRLAWDLNQVAQKKAYINLKKSDPVQGIITVNDIDVCIEWPKGKVRKYKEDGVTKDGKVMSASYGYVPNTITADGEELDCYVGPNKRSERVFLILQKPTPWDISQNNLEPEEKYMLGFDSMEAARKAFVGSMPSRFFKNIREVEWEQFLKRVDKAHRKLLKHTDMESCGYLYKTKLDQYDRSVRKGDPNRVVTRDNMSACSSPDADLINLVKSLDNLEQRVSKIPRLVFKI